MSTFPFAKELKTIAKNSPKVYEAGKAKQEYDFWKELQDRTSKYSSVTYIFAGEVWTDDNFKPVQDIILKGNSNYSFAGNNVTNLKRLLENRGVKLNTSNASEAMYLFYYADSKELPELDLSNATTVYAIFNRSQIQSVDKLKLSNKCTNIEVAFSNATGLTHCIFDGEIVAKLDIHWSTLLDKESITSLINTLSSTTSGLTVTLSKTAVNTAFETASGKADGADSQEWLDLRNTKSNWTISLV